MKGGTKSIHDSPADQELALIRTKRLVVSGPIIFATIVGILSTTTSAVTFHVISVNKAHKVMDAEMVHREEDIGNGIINNNINLGKVNNLSISVDHLRNASTHASNALTDVMDSLDFNNNINHRISQDENIQYSDPAQEGYSKDINAMVSEDTLGLMDSDNSMVRLSSNTAAMVTTIIPVSGTSGRCGNRKLMKTLFVPIVNHRTRTIITKEGDRLYPSNDRSKYLLIPQYGVLSKPAKLFNQDIHIVGRTCTAHSSINATSSPTTDALFQIFTIKLKGNMSITEYCPHNNSWTSTNWTISSFTKLSLVTTNNLQIGLGEVQLLGGLSEVKRNKGSSFFPSSHEDLGTTLGGRKGQHQPDGVHQKQHFTGDQKYHPPYPRIPQPIFEFKSSTAMHRGSSFPHPADSDNHQTSSKPGKQRS